MHTKIWALGFALISLLFCGTSLATSNNWQMCDTLFDSHRDRYTLETLFRYAQIAERPKHSDNEYMWPCPDSDSVTLPNDLVPLKPSDIAIKRIKDGIQERQNNEKFRRARFDIADKESLSITCMSVDGSIELPIIFRIRMYLDLGVQLLNINISTGISIMDESDGEARVKIVPYFDLSQNELVYAAPGTDVTDVMQILSNYIGDECAFPAIHLVTNYVCEFVSHDFAHDSEDNRPIYFTGDNMDRIRKTEVYSITLTGHSLGGQAVQYIAEQGFNICRRNVSGRIPRYVAYSFASTRNRMPTRSTDNLTSFLIEGDEILYSLKLGNGQFGNIIRYQPDPSQRFNGRHSIDEVQKGICECLQGRGMISSYFE